MAPAVSIILPVFNRLRFLRATIDSVLAQSFADWELLIADDGSATETRAYLRTLDDARRIKVLWLPHRANPAAARNAALSEARGEFVAFLDSDDLWLPHKLQVQVGALRADAAPAWSYTGFTLIDESGSPLSGARAAKAPGGAAPLLDRLVKEQALVVTPSVVVRRDLIERVGGFNEELLVCEDYELWMRLASHGEAEAIDEPLVRVRRHREHSFDDITCLENLRRALEIVQASHTAPHLQAVLRRRRAGISANIARGHARGRRRLRVFATLLQSAPYSWQYRDWWLGGAAAMARASAPRIALDVIRKYRAGTRSPTAPHAPPR
jgi:GT2 family glycosyltransferase